MNEKMPRTPFSTPLSGSARETELRLRNIFSGPKKRPPVLYLGAVVDGRELENGGYLDEWARLYIWDEGEFSRYSWAVWAEGMSPLVPAEETDKMDPPLWNQWYFAGEEPEGGFVSRYAPGTDPYGEIHHGSGHFPSAILDQYHSYPEGWRVLYAEYQTGQEEAGDMRLGPVDYLGEISWGENAYAFTTTRSD